MKKLTIIRKISQTFFFVISIALFYLFFQNILLIVHKFCPFSIICFGTLSIATKTIIYPVTLLISLVLTLLSMFVGRFFCGYICFLGTYQEWIYRLFHKKCQPVVKINYIDEKKLSFLKYLVLLFIIIFSFIGLSRIHINFCPITALAWIKNISILGIICLLFITISAIFIERFWCRYLCPYAALLNLTQALGKLLKIKNWNLNRNLETCIDCNLCCKSCPMNINLLEDEFINNYNCIKCFRCLDKCPKKGTLTSKRN